MDSPDEQCALYERERFLTFHHLVPKKVHKRSQVLRLFSKEEMHTLGLWLCSDCHSTVHRHIDHLVLALNYHSKEALLGHPEIEKFVNWVAKQNKRVKKK